MNNQRLNLEIALKRMEPSSRRFRDMIIVNIDENKTIINKSLKELSIYLSQKHFGWPGAEVISFEIHQSEGDEVFLDVLWDMTGLLDKRDEVLQ